MSFTILHTHKEQRFPLPPFLPSITYLPPKPISFHPVQSARDTKPTKRLLNNMVEMSDNVGLYLELFDRSLLFFFYPGSTGRIHLYTCYNLGQPCSQKTC